MIPSWQLHLSSRRAAGQEGSNAEPTAPIRRRRPEYSRGQGREEHRFEHENIFTSHDHFLLRGRLQIARGGGRGPRRARRQRGAAAPSGDDRAGKEHHYEKRQKRRAIKVSSNGVFHRQGGAFDSTFYVQGPNLVRRVALDYFSTSACRTRSTYLIHSTGPADQLLYVRAPAGR